MLELRNMLSGTVLLAVALMAIIVMMILPVPAWLLDTGLAASFALATLIFSVTLFVERPLDFSAFPTVLLASLVLRLSLNVSSTKLIIGNGHTGTDAAGGVIESFAMFIMSGNVFLGLVVFCVLMIVNFMVITKGAARMAEVGARFALDAMPGKQLAIDSDMSAGAIDHTQARQRRETEQAETTFFGSLDGASKFVKGDAVAGLLITLLNLVVGLSVGVFSHNMPISQAIETYSILTVGDGLVTQIPAVIISIASALLLARGGATEAVDTAVIRQVTKYPLALGTVAVLMLGFAAVPGLPFVPFILGAGVLGWGAYTAWNRNDEAEPDEAAPEAGAEPGDADTPLGDLLDVDEIHLEFASDLVSMVLDAQSGLEARINSMRAHIASEFGVILPEIRLTDDLSQPAGTYVIKIHGVEQVRDRLQPNQVLALTPNSADGLPPGIDVAEPVYGAPARWISTEHREDATLAGLTVVTPTEILATHLLETIKQNFPRLLGLKALRKLLDEMVNVSNKSRAEANKKLLEELIPDKVPIEALHGVLRSLLEERVSIRNLPLILEAIAEAQPLLGAPEALCEHVRQRLAFQIVAGVRRADGTLPLVQLAPEWEDIFSHHQSDAAGPISLPQELFTALTTGLTDEIRRCSDEGMQIGVVTSMRRRRFLHLLLKAQGQTAPVFSYEEINQDVRPTIVGNVAA